MVKGDVHGWSLVVRYSHSLLDTWLLGAVQQSVVSSFCCASDIPEAEDSSYPPGLKFT